VTTLRRKSIPNIMFGTEAGLKYRPNHLNPLNIKKPYWVLAPLLAPVKMA